MARTNDGLAYRTRSTIKKQMTQGALIFAFDNDHIDYVRMAAWSAANIRRHLNIPVAVITDREDVDGFDHIIHCDRGGENHRWFGDFKTQMPWHNRTRADAYALSPWDQTLLLSKPSLGLLRRDQTLR